MNTRTLERENTDTAEGQEPGKEKRWEPYSLTEVRGKTQLPRGGLASLLLLLMAAGCCVAVCQVVLHKEALLPMYGMNYSSVYVEREAEE